MGTCIALHNFCIIYRKKFAIGWTKNVMKEAKKLSQLTFGNMEQIDIYKATK